MSDLFAQYYVSQPIKYNSVLGSAAYILASLEIEHLEDQCTEGRLAFH